MADMPLYVISIFMVREVDTSGAVQWGKTFGGEKIESALTLQSTADSGFIVGGYTKYFPEDTVNMNMFL